MAELSDLVVQYRERLQRVHHGSCLGISTVTVRATPVDTGALRRAWEPAINGAEPLSSITQAIRQLVLGDVYTFTNPLPYAPVIEYESHSPQAPSGMVRTSVLQWRRIVREQIERERRR